MHESADVIVVGAGIMGTATAWALARRGQKVLLLEQYELGHTRGSSHGGSRIIRYTHPTSDYAALMPAIFALWREAEAESGEELLRLCGGLYFAPAGDEFLRSCRAALDSLGMLYTQPDSAEMARRWPHFRLDPGDEVLYQQESGILAATRTVTTLARLAQARGVTLRTNCRVQAITPLAGGAQVTWSDGGATQTSTAARVIVTAGPWTQTLLQPLRHNPLPLRVTHQQVSYFRVQDPALWSPERCPIYIFTADPHVYGFPIFEKPGLIKVARELFDVEVDPNAERSPLPQAIRELSETVRARFVGVDPTPVQTDTCLYTETPTRDFIIDRHPDHPQIVFGAGFSGRGFKFGIGMGDLLAHLALTPPGDYAHPFWLDKFALGRYTFGAAAPSNPELFGRRRDA